MQLETLKMLSDNSCLEPHCLVRAIPSIVMVFYRYEMWHVACVFYVMWHVVLLRVIDALQKKFCASHTFDVYIISI